MLLLFFVEPESPKAYLQEVIIDVVLSLQEQDPLQLPEFCRLSILLEGPEGPKLQRELDGLEIYDLNPPSREEGLLVLEERRADGMSLQLDRKALLQRPLFPD